MLYIEKPKKGTHLIHPLEVFVWFEAKRKFFKFDKSFIHKQNSLSFLETEATLLFSLSIINLTN